MAQALRLGFDHERDLFVLPHRSWFVSRLQVIVDAEARSPRAWPAGRSGRAPRGSSPWAFRIARLATLSGLTEAEVRARSARGSACARSSSASIPAPPSSQRRRAYMYSTYEEPLGGKVECEADPATAKRSSSWAAAPTASARASSSTIAACHAAFALRKRASRPSWSTATRRRSPPTTTPPTGSISSR